MQADKFRERMLLCSAVAALKRHADRSQLARVAILRLVHRQLAGAWAGWTVTVQASIPPLHSTDALAVLTIRLCTKPACLRLRSSLHTHSNLQIRFFGAQEMAQRRVAAAALQRRALSRMLGLTLRSSLGAWRRLTACMATARSLLRRHLLALQQDAFMAWRCARL